MRSQMETVLRRAGEILLRAEGIRAEEKTGRADLVTQFDRTIKDFLEIGKPLPDAIFATNDESAIGAMEALLEEGVKVPEQVSIIGCDDIELAQRVRPSMTTIRTSFEKQGVQAVEQLIRLIQEHAVGEIEILYGRIIPRESTSYRE